VLSQKALRRLLGLVQYAMAQQDIRYYLNGLLVVVEDRQLKLVGDGRASTGVCDRSSSTRAAAPGGHRAEKDVLELVKLLADSDEEVRIELSTTQGGVQLRHVEVVSSW